MFTTLKSSCVHVLQKYKWQVTLARSHTWHLSPYLHAPVSVKVRHSSLCKHAS